MRTASPRRAQAATWPWRVAPAQLVLRDLILGAGFLAAGPRALAYPVCLIVLSSRLPGHLTDHAGSAGRSLLRRPSEVV